MKDPKLMHLLVEPFSFQCFFFNSLREKNFVYLFVSGSKRALPVTAKDEDEQFTPLLSILKIHWSQVLIARY